MCDHPGEARLWADNHQRFSDDIAALFVSIGAAFGTLHRIRFDAPWRARVKACGRPASAR